jgi:hypothetical protein
MVFEHQDEHHLRWAAICSIADKIFVSSAIRAGTVRDRRSLPSVLGHAQPRQAVEPPAAAAYARNPPP